MDGPAAQFHADALITEELIVVGSDARPEGHLYAFERNSGDVRWKVPFPAGVSAQTLRYGDAVLVATASGEVLALDLEDGIPLWIVSDAPLGLEGVIGGDPTLAGRSFVVPWRTGIVDAIDAETGDLIWRTDLGARLGTSAAFFGGEIIVGGLDGRFRRLDPTTGRTVGTFEIGEGAPYGDLVTTGDGGLIAMWAAGGTDESMRMAGPHVVACLGVGLEEVRWQQEATDEWSTMRPAVHDGAVVIGRKGELLVFSVSDGERLSTLSVSGVPRGLGFGEGQLFVGLLSGGVLAYPAGSAVPAPAR